MKLTFSHSTGASLIFRRLNTCPLYVGFIEDKVALGQVFLPGLRFFSDSFIPPTLQVHSFIPMFLQLISPLNNTLQ